MGKELLAVRRAEMARDAKHCRHNPADEPAKEDLQLLRAKYAEEQITEYVNRVVAAAPPLSGDQLDRLAILLRNPNPAKGHA